MQKYYHSLRMTASGGSEADDRIRGERSGLKSKRMSFRVSDYTDSQQNHIYNWADS